MRLTDGVHLVASGKLGVSLTHPIDCNAYAVRCGDEYVLIDSGVGMETARILDVLRSDGIPADRIRRLVLTHYHLDHSGGAAALRQGLGLDVWAGPMTARALEAGDEEAISLAAAKRAGIYPDSVTFMPCPVARVLQPGEPVSIGDTTILPIAAPGHSRDMTCILVRQAGRALLFSGDAIFHGGRIVLQCTWDCDVPAYFETLRMLAGLEFDMLFPGHGLWSLADGRRHAREAMSFVTRLLPPPNL